jgi:ribose-phosphate pyrophosphokinase
MKLQVFSGLQNIALATGICNNLSLNLGNVKHHQFPSGETWCQYGENIRGGDLFIVEPISKPANDALMRILIMSDAARRASAGRVTVVIPYFGYARQDRKDKSRVPISAKLVMDMLEAAGVQRVLTMDLHNPAIQGFTNIPVDHLYAMPLFFNALGDVIQNPSDVVFASPDIGAIKRTEAYQKCLADSSFAVCPKTRVSETEVKTHSIIGDVKDKVVILSDDLTESCGTILGAASQCREAGAKYICACITHGLITDMGFQRLMLGHSLDAIFVTDSVPLSLPPDIATPEYLWKKFKLKIVSSAPLFAKAINCIHNDESVSGLFKIEGF